MHVPDPVISVAIAPKDNAAEIKMSKALRRFTKEDPTFCVKVDKESGETIVSGMGELHLEVYIERMKREYDAEVRTRLRRTEDEITARLVDVGVSEEDLQLAAVAARAEGDGALALTLGRRLQRLADGSR